ncbi:MAG TPA: hypothetical protein VFF37_17530 [Streptomyces sp.]|nr:hypothetical protein [Streptomyces sp.]
MLSAELAEIIAELVEGAPADRSTYSTDDDGQRTAEVLLKPYTDRADLYRSTGSGAVAREIPISAATGRGVAVGERGDGGQQFARRITAQGVRVGAGPADNRVQAAAREELSRSSGSG